MEEIESIEQILERRKEVEAELIEYLEEIESDFDLDDIKSIIYNEEGQDDLTDIIAMFDDGDVESLSNVLEVVNDAWNYFPHKVLGGISPAEMILKCRTENGGVSNAAQRNGALPGSISVTVRYDEKLQEITKVKEHPALLSEGATFIYLLQNIFMEYPEIEQKYPAGVLGLSINGFPPKAYSPLFDGDVVALSVEEISQNKT